jgi:hypothetical protein
MTTDLRLTTINKLHRRLMRLEKALRYYANRKSYREDDWGVAAVIGEYGDAGKKARLALGKAACGKLWEKKPS